MADLSAIVAGAGPLIALAKLDRIGLLCGFFGEVFVPDAVARECTIEIIGTGALIVAAKRRGLVTEVRPLLISLVREGYRLSDRLVQALLEMSGEPRESR